MGERRKERLQNNNLLQHSLLLQTSGISSKLNQSLGKRTITKQNGITLIALIVTIVVLLILAGITISLVFSDNGIIKKAQEAAEKTNQAVSNEQAELNELYGYLENTLNGISGGSTPEEPTLPSDGTYSELKGVNTPNLGEGMTPIKWDSNTNDWVETTGSDPEWYDYSAKKWANAKVEVDGVESYFVWIPRYAYKITSGYHQSGAEINSTTPEEGAGTIEIEFMKEKSNEGATGQTIVEYNTETTKNYTQFPNGYVIHPAFNYGEEVSGLWVAKFEASPVGATTDVANSEYDGTDKKLQVVPGVSSWRSITISNAYDVCRTYNQGLNSHLMKNDEWGAVAYLSKSKYGKETEEVWINNSSSYITGSAGNSASAATDTGTTNDYTSAQGVEASTTGNVYGVYDMSGGSWEYVAAYLDNGNTNLTTYGNSLYTSTGTKTKNVYIVGSEDTKLVNYNANASKYGDAIYEISNATYNDSVIESNQSWYNDWSEFLYSNWTFFNRGGGYSYTSSAGVFFFGFNDGNAYNARSFRPVLVVL